MFLAALLLAQTACPVMDANLPAPLAAWATPGFGEPMDMTKPVVMLTVPRADVRGLPAGAREGGATSLPFSIKKPGVYGIAIDQGAWIDVVPVGGAPLTSVQHGHGPECSTIRKIVRFDLKPGIYTVFVSGLTSVNVKIFLVRPE